MSAWPWEQMRSRMARSVLDRVAGDVEWVDTSGEPWLPEELPVRRVHANAAMLVGGVRALLLQSPHPAAMQAVVDHSGYRSDPWERFRRIVSFMYATTFGSHDQATARIDHVRRIHDQVTGVMPDATPYQASDPDLLMWIRSMSPKSTASWWSTELTRAQLSLAEADQSAGVVAITRESSASSPPLLPGIHFGSFVRVAHRDREGSTDRLLRQTAPGCVVPNSPSGSTPYGSSACDRSERRF